MRRVLGANMIRDVIENADYLLEHQRRRLLEEFDKRANPNGLSGSAQDAIVITKLDLFDFLKTILGIGELELSTEEKLRVTHWFNDRD